MIFYQILSFRDRIRRAIAQQINWFLKNCSDSQDIQELSRFHSGNTFQLEKLLILLTAENIRSPWTSFMVRNSRDNY